jgi:hypothetical protein
LARFAKLRGRTGLATSTTADWRLSGGRLAGWKFAGSGRVTVHKLSEAMELAGHRKRLGITTKGFMVLGSCLTVIPAGEARTLAGDTNKVCILGPESLESVSAFLHLI